MKSLKEAWRVRSPKERRLLILGFVAVLIALLYHGLYNPLTVSIAQAEKNLKNDVELLAWIEKESPRVLAARGGAKQSFQGSLFALAEKQFKNLSEDSPRITREDESTVSIAYSRVNFDRLIGALQQVQTQEGVSIESFRASSVNEVGLVQANFKLSR